MTTPSMATSRVLLFTINSKRPESLEVFILAQRKGFEVRILCEASSPTERPSMRVQSTLEYLFDYKAIVAWLESQPIPGRLATS